MIHSMTAFASARGEAAPFSWAWELRSVNGRGLDLRLRVPDWLEGLEAALRADLSAGLARGSVTLSLKLARSEETAPVQVNPQMLQTVLAGLQVVQDGAAAQGVEVTAPSTAEILQIRGVLEAASGAEDTAPLVRQLKTEFKAVLADFIDMRAREGKALFDVLSGQVDQVEALTAQAADLVAGRRAAMDAAIRANLAKVMDNIAEADPDRIAQELALIAVKADVTEELDRLRAHVAAARALLGQGSTGGGAVGRKLDFLTQEFNREANTLCSKSQNSDLTAVGLELKAVIDQMREQVQNVE